jgi:hypothetical protein
MTDPARRLPAPLRVSEPYKPRDPCNPSPRPGPASLRVSDAIGADKPCTAPPPVSPPASLWGAEGRVLLEPEGVRLVLGIMELARLGPAHRGAGAPSNPVAYLREVLRLAEAGAVPASCAPATSGRSFVAYLPESGAQVTVTEAAAIWGCSPQAIRKAIRAGRLQGRRQGGQWWLSEVAVREAAGRRGRGRKAGRVLADHGRRVVGEDQP